MVRATFIFQISYLFSFLTLNSGLTPLWGLRKGTKAKGKTPEYRGPAVYSTTQGTLHDGVIHELTYGFFFVVSPLVCNSETTSQVIYFVVHIEHFPHPPPLRKKELDPRRWTDFEYFTYKPPKKKPPLISLPRFAPFMFPLKVFQGKCAYSPC